MGTMGTDARPATTQRHQHNGEMVRIKMAEGGGGGGQGLGEDVFTCGRVLCAIMDVVKMMITAGTKKDSLPSKSWKEFYIRVRIVLVRLIDGE